MSRHYRRRIARELKKRSISGIEEILKNIYADGVEAGATKSFDSGVKHTQLMFKKALKEVYGFGDKRFNRIIEYMENELEEGE